MKLSEEEYRFFSRLAEYVAALLLLISFFEISRFVSLSFEAMLFFGASRMLESAAVSVGNHWRVPIVRLVSWIIAPAFMLAALHFVLMVEKHDALLSWRPADGLPLLSVTVIILYAVFTALSLNAAIRSALIAVLSRFASEEKSGA